MAAVIKHKNHFIKALLKRKGDIISLSLSQFSFTFLLLCNRGSNLRETNDKGRNALHWAGEVSSALRLACPHVLITSTCWMSCPQSGNESAVELLMDEGLSLLEEDIEGNLPAHVAIRSGADAAIVLKLVAREPKILSKVQNVPAAQGFPSYDTWCTPKGRTTSIQKARESLLWLVL